MLPGQNVDITQEETNINFLFNLALEKLVFMPFGYLVDKYRWDFLSGKISEANLNCYWHQLRSKIQGLIPPNIRNESQFDPGAKYQIAADIDYVKYFTGQIYEFQFLKALCLAARQYDPRNPKKFPLHKCNIFGSKRAGYLMKEMMKMGSSLPWKEAMKKITGNNEMSTQAFRDYFKPLENWLKRYNEENGVTVG